MSQTLAKIKTLKGLLEKEEQLQLELFDNITIVRGNVLLISGNVGVGKTTVSANMLSSFLNKNYKALYITMDPLYITQILASILLKKDILKTTRSDIENILNKYDNFGMLMLPLRIEDIVEAIKTFKPDVFFINVVETIEPIKGFVNRDSELIYIIQQLRKVAQETKSVGILLSLGNQDTKYGFSRDVAIQSQIHILMRKRPNADTIWYRVTKNAYACNDEQTTGELKVDWDTRTVSPLNLSKRRGKACQ